MKVEGSKRAKLLTNVMNFLKLEFQGEGKSMDIFCNNAYTIFSYKDSLI